MVLPASHAVPVYLRAPSGRTALYYVPQPEEESLQAQEAKQLMQDRSRPETHLNVGDAVYRQGQLASVVAVDHSLSPPSYVVRMAQSGEEVNCELNNLVILNGLNMLQDQLWNPEVQQPDLQGRVLEEQAWKMQMELQDGHDLQGTGGSKNYALQAVTEALDRAEDQLWNPQVQQPDLQGRALEERAWKMQMQFQDGHDLQGTGGSKNYALQAVTEALDRAEVSFSGFGNVQDFEVHDPKSGLQASRDRVPAPHMGNALIEETLAGFAKSTRVLPTDDVEAIPGCMDARSSRDHMAITLVKEDERMGENRSMQFRAPSNLGRNGTISFQPASLIEFDNISPVSDEAQRQGEERMVRGSTDANVPSAFEPSLQADLAHHIVEDAVKDNELLRNTLRNLALHGLIEDALPQMPLPDCEQMVQDFPLAHEEAHEHCMKKAPIPVDERPESKEEVQHNYLLDFVLQTDRLGPGRATMPDFARVSRKVGQGSCGAEKIRKLAPRKVPKLPRHSRDHLVDLVLAGPGNTTPNFAPRGLQRGSTLKGQVKSTCYGDFPPRKVAPRRQGGKVQPTTLPPVSKKMYNWQ
ncbi:CSP domain-containing protein [Durusdinium trenchii]|uniref:CSP domain-containing protein n=1 Tax=Durusdinium trenchii TaxID=1381693 RepID=A0ABP0MTT9_9DINO